MTQAEALQNVTDTLTSFRAQRGEPTEIRIYEGERSLVIRHGWSKSSINNGTQTVFLIASPFFTYPSKGYPNYGRLGSIDRIDYGQAVYVISGEIQSPKEEGGYWLLPVREA